MATRSMIGVKNKDGTITMIYCHWDGYPGNNGLILYKHYRSEEKIASLIALGNLSNLGEEIGCKHDMHAILERPHEIQAETIKWCKAYERDRGDEDQAAVTFKSMSEIQSHAKDSWVDFIYLFDNGEWKFTATGGSMESLYRMLLQEGLVDPIEELMVEAKTATG